MTKAVCIVLLLFSTLAFGQRDKVYHTTAGFGITLGFSAATHHPTLGLIAGVGAGVAKELWDSQHPHHDASARDALATAAGAGSAFVLWKYAIARKRPTIAAVPTSSQAEKKPDGTPGALVMAQGAGGH
jgi:hypothetical protein